MVCITYGPQADHYHLSSILIESMFTTVKFHDSVSVVRTKCFNTETTSLFAIGLEVLADIMLVVLRTLNKKIKYYTNQYAFSVWSIFNKHRFSYSLTFLFLSFCVSATHTHVSYKWQEQGKEAMYCQLLLSNYMLTDFAAVWPLSIESGGMKTVLSYGIVIIIE